MANYSNPDDAFKHVASILNSIENEVLVEGFTDILLEGVGIAKQGCPVNEGELRADIHYDVKETKTTLEGAIGNTLKYAPYVHNGTGIYAVNGDGRQSKWKYMVPSGKYKGWHITRGQKPKPYLKETLYKLKEIFPSKMADAIRADLGGKR